MKLTDSIIEKLEQDINVSRYLKTLNRGKIYIILTFLSVLTGVIIFVQQHPDVYRATATILMSEPAPSGGGLGLMLSQLSRLKSVPFIPGFLPEVSGTSGRSKIVHILRSRTLAERVARHLGLNVPIRVQIAEFKSGKICISYKSTDSELAANIVNYYPVVLKNYLDESSISLARRGRIELEKKINKARAELEAAEKSDDKYPREVWALSDTYRFLRQQYELSKIEEIKDPLYFEVLDPALVPEHPIGPKRKSNIILGALAGLCLGIGIAFLRERLDDTIHDTDTIEKVVGLPVLVNPVSVKGTNGVSNPVTEEDRLLAKNFQLMIEGLPNHQGQQTTNHEQRTTKILFTSVDNSRIKSLLMCRLTFALAEKGKSILIIDCDSGDKNILRALGKNLELGGIKLIPADKIDSVKLKNLISTPSLKYDYTFMNTASGLISSRVLELATQADLILTTVTLGQTSGSALNEHKINLEKANSQIHALLSEDKETESIIQ